MEELLQTEVLIIGCGIAGAVAAMQLADAGIPVTVVTRAAKLVETNTYYAQGGIIFRGADDSPELLEKDILHAGAGHSNPTAAKILSTEGPELVRKILIDKIGVQFDHNHGFLDEELSLAREGGHSIPRIVHAADITGMAIQVALEKALQERANIQLLAGYTAIDLLTPSHHSTNRLAVYQPPSCVGAYILEQATGKVIRVLATHTILATGGLGQIYLHNTNPAGARGDGIAMAYRASARTINLEFIQFHPTTFYHSQAPRFLISEAVRGDGARLVLANGEPFMQQYDPQWKDLASRDVVSRAIYHQMLAKDLHNVYLDLRSYIPEARIREHFPNIMKDCLQYGIDITRDLVPVVPGAHYSCGGVWVDMWGESTIRNLYAIGEVACTGLHGANRLASTSLLEGLVWGKRVADRISERLDSAKSSPAAFDPATIPSWQESGKSEPDPALIWQDMSVIKHMMWNYVGLVRTTRRLQRALRELRQLETEIENFYRATALTDSLIGLRNAVRTSVIVAAAAWENRQSMGCHYRE
jgi:L-aspartate oxidase